MSPVPTFWSESTGKIRRYLRCYQDSAGRQLGVPGAGEKSPRCRSAGGYCNAMRVLDEVEAEWSKHQDGRRYRTGYDRSTVALRDEKGRAVTVDSLLEAHGESYTHTAYAFANRRDDCEWSCDFVKICPLFDDGSRVEDAIQDMYTERDPLSYYQGKEKG